MNRIRSCLNIFTERRVALYLDYRLIVRYCCLSVPRIWNGLFCNGEKIPIEKVGRGGKNSACVSLVSRATNSGRGQIGRVKFAAILDPNSNFEGNRALNRGKTPPRFPLLIILRIFGREILGSIFEGRRTRHHSARVPAICFDQVWK